MADLTAAWALSLVVTTVLRWVDNSANLKAVWMAELMGVSMVGWMVVWMAESRADEMAGKRAGWMAALKVAY